MSELKNKVRMAQVEAGEQSVIESLRTKGLLPNATALASSAESKATSELNAVPSKVSFALDSEQLAAVRSLYEGRTPESNGGIMFAVLGQACIDERMEEYGTAEFRWLNSEQYTKIRAVILEQLANGQVANTSVSDGTTDQD